MSAITEPKMTTRAIAQWFGTNRTCAFAVGQELAGCDFVAVTFAGGMTELPYIGARSLAVNDLHRHVINLGIVVGDAELNRQLRNRLRRVLFHPDVLANAQERCRLRDAAQSRGLFHSEQEIGLHDRLDWAVDYFIATWMTRAGQAGTDGEFRGGLSVRWDAGGGGSAVRFRSAASSLRAWYEALARAEFSTLDCFEFIGKVKDRKGFGLYNDPPFPGPGDTYRHKFTEAKHRKLAKVLGEYQDTRVVCRFYDHPLIHELYPEGRWTWRRLVGRKQTNEAADELLIINGPSFAPSAARAGTGATGGAG